MVFAPIPHKSAPRRRSAALPTLLVLATAAAFALSTPALAAEGKAGSNEALLVGQIVLLITVGRLLGEAMLRLGQPAVMGQLLAGILLGPSVLGLLWPDAQH